MATFDFKKTLRLIQETQKGKERNMYPHVRDLFVHVLGHSPENIYVDSTQDDAGGNAPDLTIRCDTGLTDGKDKMIYHDWIVVEAKDERDAFLDPKKREKIFEEKQKYIRPETEWFVMIDPECIVIRPIAVRTKIASDKDKVFKWEDFESAKHFKDKLFVLEAGSAGDSPALTAFRNGDETRISVVTVDVSRDKKEKLSKKELENLAIAKKDFLGVIRTCTRMLQLACAHALTDWRQKISNLYQEGEQFKKQWGGYTLSFDPLVVEGKRQFNSKEDADAHKKQSQALKKKIKNNLAIAKLALLALPAYYQRSGNDEAETNSFATESANLILARVLLLRFFEDHNFFGNKKYVCGGGVKALQDFMRYYQKGYATLLSAAYKQGNKIYSEAFDETDMDWVLSSPSQRVSRAIEISMMLLSHFNFSTISGDILTGVYDRFLDREQRKVMGEFYTPPSVARYIIQRLDVQLTESVFDPACGSGTFLLEAFEHITKGDIRAGRGDYGQMMKALQNIGGNDLNPFSAVMAQIQMLWHLLPLKFDLKEKGFPDIRVTGSVNAITVSGDMHEQSDSNILYNDIDQPVHDVVIGNPPYVRPERGGDFDEDTQKFFHEIGGASKNLYDLFIYKALTKWCRSANGDGKKHGRLGFVVPLSFCDSRNSEPLRNLFALGGRFRIIEIVDMEAISPLVFDAAVNPIVLLAENRPAKKTDKIILRVAGNESVVDEREFNLMQSSESKFKYADVFTTDGRILTKLDMRRKRIIDNMHKANSTLADIAQPYWVGIGKKRRIEKWVIEKPLGDDALQNGNGKNGDSESQKMRWEERRMLGRGAVSRRQAKISANGNGLPYYKGENISNCLIEGKPAQNNVLPDSPDDASFWRYRDILPSVGYAFMRISLGITAARFNPHQCAFFDTATLLFPNAEWKEFPLDIAMTSQVYQFYYACYLRECPVQELWSNCYPRTLEKIPLPSTLLKSSKRLGKLRESFLDLCKKVNVRIEALSGFLREAGAEKLKDACRAKELPIKWSDGLNGKAVTINAPTLDSVSVKKNRLQLEGGQWLEINDADIMQRVAAALIVYHGQEMKREDFQKMLIPLGGQILADFITKVREYDSGAYDNKLAKVMAEVDDVVGAAFELSKDDIKYVQNEMQKDTFLRNIRPKMPFVERRRQGLVDALAKPERYMRKKSQ